jgi:hypothetical protein
VHPPALENGEEPRLQLQGELVDVGEQEGAAAGALEGAGERLPGAGEGAFLEPEQLGGEEVGRDRPDVHDHERARGAPAGQVHRLGHRRLAAAGLALDEHVGFGGRHLLEGRDQRPHRGRTTDQPEGLRRRGPRQLQDLVGGDHAQPGVAELEAFAGGDDRLDHPEAAQEGAVLRAEIADPQVDPDAQLAVRPGHPRIAEDEVRQAARADAQVALELVAQADVGPGDHLDAHPSASQGGRGCPGLRLEERVGILHGASVTSRSWVWPGTTTTRRSTARSSGWRRLTACAPAGSARRMSGVTPRLRPST